MGEGVIAVVLFKVGWLGLVLAKDPVLLVEFSLVLHESLELLEVAVVAQVESKGHCRVNLLIMDLLGSLLVECNVVLLDCIEVVGDSRQGIMWVQEDQIVFLHPDKVVGFFGAPSNDPTVELLHEEGSDWVEILRPHLLQAKPG